MDWGRVILRYGLLEDEDGKHNRRMRRQVYINTCVVVENFHALPGLPLCCKGCAGEVTTRLYSLQLKWWERRVVVACLTAITKT